VGSPQAVGPAEATPGQDGSYDGAVGPKTRRSMVWFWLFLVALVAVTFGGARAAMTSEECDDRPKTWEWFPPGYECGFRP